MSNTTNDDPADCYGGHTALERSVRGSYRNNGSRSLAVMTYRIVQSVTAFAAHVGRVLPGRNRRTRRRGSQQTQTTEMIHDDSARRNVGHGKEDTDSEPNAVFVTSTGREALDRERDGPDELDLPTAFVTDGGQTFTIESSGEREWLASDATVNVGDMR